MLVGKSTLSTQHLSLKFLTVPKVQRTDKQQLSFVFCLSVQQRKKQKNDFLVLPDKKK